MKVNMGGDKKWKKSAMMDDAVVAELLLQLNAPPPSPPPKPALSAEWKVRQRRSKTLTRASPTTPLSWSGGTSVSGGGVVDGGFEESSQPKPTPKKPETSRSKVTSEATTGKRPRKKKTLAELKAAELSLEEESKQLIEEVKKVRANLDRERSSNEKLKRLKLELESQKTNREGGTSSPNQVATTASSPTQKLTSSDLPTATVPRIDSVYTSPKQCSPFAIPDLNLPLEDDCNIEVQCQAS